MKKILIVKLAAIGDVIMALPMLDEIKREYPDAEVTWIVGECAVSIIEMFPVHHVICINERKLLIGNSFERMQTIFSVWRKIAFEHFDLILLGHSDRRYRIITLLTKGLQRSFGQSKEKRKFPIPARHFTDEYVRLVHNNDCRQQVTPPALLSLPRTEKTATLLQGTCEGRRVVLAPGGAKNILADNKIRRWPIDNFVQLARLLREKGFFIILTGAKSDEWILPYFSEITTVNLVGKTSLQELISVFSAVDLVVTHDSGPMHLAGLAGSRILALFGPTNPYEIAPRSKQLQFLWYPEKYACCPCYDGKTYAKCADNVCLREITPKQVYVEILQMLGMSI
ncbi:MAG: glycosyltransferase family 9 protein [Acidaminococcaceae bacterium]